MKFYCPLQDLDFLPNPCPEQGQDFWSKNTTFCFCFHSIQKPPKRVKTQIYFLFVCSVCFIPILKLSKIGCQADILYKKNSIILDNWKHFSKPCSCVPYFPYLINCVPLDLGLGGLGAPLFVVEGGHIGAGEDDALEGLHPAHLPTDPWLLPN